MKVIFNGSNEYLVKLKSSSQQNFNAIQSEAVKELKTEVNALREQINSTIRNDVS